MNKDEALKMAIETMKIWNGKSVKTNTASFRIDFEGAIQTCKEALEQPAQEPVAYGCKAIGGEMDGKIYGAWYDKSGLDDKEKDFEIVALYTHPAPSWQGLSDDEVGNLIARYEYAVHPDLDGFTRAIEQALKERNK